jgi:hypothetical protein
MHCSNCFLLSTLCVSHCLAVAYAQVPDIDIEVAAIIEPQPRCRMLFKKNGKSGKIRVNVMDEIRDLNVSSWESGELYSDVEVKKFNSSDLEIAENDKLGFFMREILSSEDDDSLILVYLRNGFLKFSKSRILTKLRIE